MGREERITRRAFLRRSSGLVIAAGLLPLGRRVTGERRESRLLLAVRDVHLGETGEKDCWAAMKRLGVDAAEVVVRRDMSCPNLFAGEKSYGIGTDSAVKMLGEKLQSEGLRISAFCLENRFDEEPEEEISWTVSVARAAEKLGVRAIRIDVVPRRLSGDEFLKFAVETCKKIVEKSEETRAKFGIENHGGTTNRVEFLEKLFEGVASERTGLTLDTGNFYWFGYPLEQLYRIYAKFSRRVFHTHCKTIRYPKEVRNKERAVGWEYGKYNCPIYEGDIDFGKVIGILREAGYENDLCIENESLGKFGEEKRGEVLRKEIEFLKGLL